MLPGRGPSLPVHPWFGMAFNPGLAYLAIGKFTVMRTLFILLFGFVPVLCWTQSGTVAAGVEATGDGGRMSVSVGQVAAITLFGVDGTMNQGVQQPYSSGLSTSLGRIPEEGVLVFPNPTDGPVFIHAPGARPWTYTLHAGDGRLVRSGVLTAPRARLDLLSLPSGPYILQVRGEELPGGTHRILKIH